MKNLPWTNYLIEFVTVVLGILLAFGLNTYYSNQIEQERVSHYLEGVKLEIQENFIEVEDKLAYHKDILIQLSKNPENVILRLKSASVKNYAWQIAQENSISQHISYKLYRKLAEIYAMQLLLEQNGTEASNMMSHVNVLSPFYIVGVDVNDEEAMEFAKSVKTGWIPIFEDFVHYEEKLTKLYMEALVML
ncbi:MAG: hypothetical protein ABJH98_18755 [Reichenbachiella sp.]|uniref:hypothetical protein n=1 Tax=Reichenbachiella sp. TaxID=2184521 RepID=UPI003298594D